MHYVQVRTESIRLSRRTGSPVTPPSRERPPPSVRVVMIRDRPQGVVEPVARRTVLVGNFTQPGKHVLHERLAEGVAP